MNLASRTAHARLMRALRVCVLRVCVLRVCTLRVSALPVSALPVSALPVSALRVSALRVCAVRVRMLSFACVLVALASPMYGQVKPPDPSTLKVSGALSGVQIYAMTCVACHQADGGGMPAMYPPLASSEYVTGNEQRLIHIVLRGLTGEVEVEGEMFKGEMPGWAPALNDAQVALVLTYIRSAFGNKAPAVTAERVATVRAASALRKKPYTAAELPKLIGPLK